MWHDWSCLNECTSPCDWYKTVIKSERLKAEDGVKAKKWATLGVEGRNGKRVIRDAINVLSIHLLLKTHFW